MIFQKYISETLFTNHISVVIVQSLQLS